MQQELDVLTTLVVTQQASEREEQKCRNDDRQKRGAATFIQSYWWWLLARKELQRLQKQAKTLYFIPVDDSRMIYLEEREWYDPSNEKTIRFEFWYKICNYLVSSKQS